MTTGDKIVDEFLRGLGRTQFQFMLVGSFSSNFYGVPRSTEDLDLVVQLSSMDQIHFLARSLGDKFQTNFQKSFELITGTEKFEFIFSNSRFKVELFLLGNDEHDQSRFHRRVKINFSDIVAYLPTAEDVIITKLRWMREKDKQDIRNVIEVQAKQLDWEYIESWCKTHQTIDSLNALRNS